MAEGAKRRPRPARRPLAYALIVLLAAVGGVGWMVAAGAQTTTAEAAACPADAECITAHTATGAHLFTVEWAITRDQTTCGLMHRPEMAADHGMVFDFFVERLVSFWMSNTLISLDMVFIRADGTVLNIAENTTPLSLQGVPSAGPVRYVLEVIAGTADRIGLAPGDVIDLERAPGMTEGTAVCFPAL